MSRTMVCGKNMAKLMRAPRPICGRPIPAPPLPDRQSKCDFESKLGAKQRAHFFANDAVSP